MSLGFRTEANLEAFKQQLKEKLYADEDTKTYTVLALVFIGLFVLLIAALVAYAVLKTYKGTFAYGGSVFVNPCPYGGAWVPFGANQCAYVLCAPRTNGNLNPGFFESQQDCINSFPDQLKVYPVAGSQNGVSFAYCSTQQGNLPSNWGSRPTVFSGSQNGNQMDVCRRTVAEYNANLRFGASCDLSNGPRLCPDTSQPNCTVVKSLYLNPFDLGPLNCNKYAACASGQCTNIFTTGQMPSYFSNMRLGTCDTVDPCATCPTVCMTANPSNQAAALPGSSAKIQPQSGSSIDTVASTNGCPSGTCASPNACCYSIATSLNLPYQLFSSTSDCPQPSASVSCTPDYNAPTTCRTSNCSQLMRNDTNGASFWYCSTKSPGQSDIAFSFVNPNDCDNAVKQLNGNWLGIKCDPSKGAIACIVGTTGCVGLSDIPNAPPDIATNLTNYLGGGARKLTGFPCISRTKSCPSDGIPSCTYSTDTTLVDCQSCGNLPCGKTGWVCQADATVGAICQQSTDSSNTIEEACTLMGTTATCGCACLFPGQVCSQGNVLGRPCEMYIPNINDVMLPISAVCGDGSPMRSSQMWSTSQKKCVYSVPYLDSGSFTTYQPPTQVDTNNVCPNSAPSTWYTTTDSSSIYFINELGIYLPKYYPCTLPVYEACHGDSPILPPSPIESAPAPYCSFNTFSGINPMGGFASSSAMCVMENVPILESQFANIPMCLSYIDDGAKSNFVMSACVDPGVVDGNKGSVAGSPIPNAANLYAGNACGTCSNTGAMVNVCPLAPSSLSGFTTPNECKTMSGWTEYASSNFSADTQTAFNTWAKYNSTAYTTLVPSLYASIQGTNSGNYSATLLANKCPNPPALVDGSLGYCSTSYPSKQGQCTSDSGFPSC